MKKIICFFAAAVMTVSAAMPALAASSKVTVKNNTSSKSVSYTYDSADKGENVKSIKALMTKLSEVTKAKMRTQTLTVTSDSADGSPVSFKLRLSIPETVKKPTASYYDALDYYKLKVNAENGTLLYSDENEDGETDKDEGYRDIPLGVLNTSKAKESATYNITIAADSGVTDTSVSSAARNLDWSIVSEPYTEPEKTPSPEPQQTEAPEASAQPETSPSASPQATPVATAKVKSDKNGNYSLPSGTYEVGNDIDADKYTLKGSGLVNIYNSDGALERTVALKDKNDKTSSGVTEFVVNLKKGEKIDVENEATLEPYTAPTASPAPTATAKPSQTSSPSASNTSTSKSNPKTGDNMPLTAAISAGMAALIAAAILGLKKKSK